MAALLLQRRAVTRDTDTSLPVVAVLVMLALAIPEAAVGEELTLTARVLPEQPIFTGNQQEPQVHQHRITATPAQVDVVAVTEVEPRGLRVVTVVTAFLAAAVAL
jgi:hypothetical protein